MSNSVAKKARRRSNVFENDYEDLIFSTDAPIKVKNIPTEKPRKERPLKKKDNEPKDSFGEAISKVPVNCKCNKCGTATNGVLLAVMFCALSGLNTPFVSYDCPSCNHKGRRSVAAKALPTEQFERLYF